MNLPDIPEYLADYFNFIIDFSISPLKALEPFKKRAEIDKKLVTFAALGTLFTWLNVLLLQKLAQANNDESSILQNVDKVDADTLPFIILLGVILFSIIVHVAIKLVMFISIWSQKEKFFKKEIYVINIKNTINGALGFFSFAPLIVVVLFELTMAIIYALNPHEISMTLLIILMVPAISFAVVCVFYYLPHALSALHAPDLRKKVYSLIFTLYGVIMFLIAVASRFLK